MRILTTLALLVALTAPPALADPERYRLQSELSTVGFSYVMAGQQVNGRMPVETADITLDLDRPSNSRVSAVMRADLADAGPDFANEAMKGPEVLDTRRFPEIRFASTRVTETGSGASVEGEITIRDVTRPITLDAQFFRQRGTDEGDRSRLSIVMRGTISRQAFGASGFGGVVGDQIDLTILARIARDG